MILSFGASVILGMDFCNQHVEAIWPKLELVQLANGTADFVVHHPGTRVASQDPLPNKVEYPSTGGWTSPLVLKVRSIVIPSKSQVGVNTRAERNGHVVQETILIAYDTHAISVKIGPLISKPNLPLLILVANYDDTLK